MVVASKANWGDSSNPWGCILPKGSATWRHVSVFFSALGTWVLKEAVRAGTETGLYFIHHQTTYCSWSSALSREQPWGRMINALWVWGGWLRG